MEDKKEDDGERFGGARKKPEEKPFGAKQSNEDAWGAAASKSEEKEDEGAFGAARKKP
jgi:hypothetical protein